MSQDIFTLDPIQKETPEHVIPAGLGGTIEVRGLIDAATNNLLGRTIERDLTQALVFIVNALELQSRRGKTAGYTIDLGPDADYRLKSGFKPEIKLAGIAKLKKDDSVVIEVRARSEEEARRLMAGVEKKYGIKITDENTRVVSKSQFIRDPAPISTSIGGASQLRAIAKIGFEAAALQLGRQTVLSDAFNDVRSWILEGARHYDRNAQSDCMEPTSLCNHDYRAEVWSELPNLETSPFQHRVFVFSNHAEGGAWAAVELFGHIRFTCILSRMPIVVQVGAGYLNDPIDRSIRTCTGIECPVGLNHVDGHGLDVEMSREALACLMKNIYELHSESALSAIAGEVVEQSLPNEGQVLEDVDIHRFSALAAERFVKHSLRIDSEKTLRVSDVLGQDEDEGDS